MAAPEYDYTSDYFDLFRSSSQRSAEVIMPFLLDLLRPRSILDVGCGVGSWLRVARENRIDDVLGIDGYWVAENDLEIPSFCFFSALLGDDFDLGRSFDLAMCLEVAEHLPPHSANTMIDFLVRHAPIVFFSAAVPDQGGDGHVNEAKASYWRGLFAARGYACFDPIRSRFWSDDSIDVWYRQNARLFVCEQIMALNPQLSEGLLAYPPMLDDLVHPELFELKSMELKTELSKLRERNDELARWGAQLQQRIERYQAFPPFAIARRIRQLARSVLS